MWCWGGEDPIFQNCATSVVLSIVPEERLSWSTTLWCRYLFVGWPLGWFGQTVEISCCSPPASTLMTTMEQSQELGKPCRTCSLPDLTGDMRRRAAPMAIEAALVPQETCIPAHSGLALFLLTRRSRHQATNQKTRQSVEVGRPCRRHLSPCIVLDSRCIASLPFRCSILTHRLSLTPLRGTHIRSRIDVRLLTGKTSLCEFSFIPRLVSACDYRHQGHRLRVDSQTTAKRAEELQPTCCTT